MNLNYRLLSKTAGTIFFVIGAFMVPCILVSLIYEESEMISLFGVLIIVFALLGILFYRMGRGADPHIRIRDGLLIVALCWLVISFLGALPYFISGLLYSFSDAFFESVAGFTTTGVTLIEDVGDVPHTILFWRSLTHWIGGMGILVFAISILPALGIGSQNIASAETSFQSIDKIRTRMTEHAKNAYLFYVAFTFAEFILLIPSTMNSFDSIIYSLDSMGNGGLYNHPGGIQSFGSLYVEIIIAIFCTLGSINFFAYQYLAQRNLRAFWNVREVKTFFVVTGTITALVVLVLYIQGPYDTFGEAFRYGVLQTISFSTTAGYSSANYDMWPEFCKWMLFCAMCIGGCSASTSGGIKMVRFSVVIGLIKRNLYKRLHPNAVVAVKVGNNPVSADAVSTITVFVFFYILIFMGATAVLSLDGEDMITTTSAVMAALSNTGLGFEGVGHGKSFDVFSGPGRFFLSMIMLVGRLELFTIIMLFTPTFWRPNR